MFLVLKFRPKDPRLISSPTTNASPSRRPRHCSILWRQIYFINRVIIPLYVAMPIITFCKDRPLYRKSHDNYQKRFPGSKILLRWTITEPTQRLEIHGSNARSLKVHERMKELIHAAAFAWTTFLSFSLCMSSKHILVFRRKHSVAVTESIWLLCPRLHPCRRDLPGLLSTKMNPQGAVETKGTKFQVN